MTWKMTCNGNLEEVDFREMVFGFCHWGFEIVMGDPSKETLNSVKR